MRLRDKTAVVTGAARGIGFAIAKAFLSEGARISLFDTDVERTRASLNAMKVDDDTALACEVDVSDAQSVASAVGESQARFGDTNILVNCAATQTPIGTIETLPLSEWNKAFAVNVTGAFLLSRAIVPQMRASGGGVIINVASQLGSVGAPGIAAYCATKGALLQLTKSMALDHAKDHIRVNSLSPGATLTDRLRARYDSDAAVIAALSPKHPIGRLGRPEEIASAAVFLASTESSFMTGADLIIDGGYTAQ